MKGELRYSSTANGGQYAIRAGTQPTPALFVDSLASMGITHRVLLPTSTLVKERGLSCLQKSAAVAMKVV